MHQKPFVVFYYKEINKNESLSIVLIVGNVFGSGHWSFIIDLLNCVYATNKWVIDSNCTTFSKLFQNILKTRKKRHFCSYEISDMTHNVCWNQFKNGF